MWALILMSVLLPYPEALKLSRKEDRPMMVIVSMNGCVWCDRLVAEVKSMQDDKLINNLVVAYANTSTHPEYLKMFPAKIYPTVYIYDKQKLTYKFAGFKTRDELLVLIKKYTSPK